MWLALNGLMQRHPNAIPIIARGGAYSPSAGEGTIGMLGVFRDAGLSPAGGGGAAAHPLRLRGRLRVRDAVGPAGRRRPGGGRGGRASRPPAPPDAGDLADYVAAIARWDPAQFATAVDIVLDAYGDGRALGRRQGAGPDGPTA